MLGTADTAVSKMGVVLREGPGWKELPLIYRGHYRVGLNKLGL